MPPDREDVAERRSVVPPAAGRSLWLAASWTGAGAALTGMVVAIVAVAFCWLPASGGAGNAGSAIRAGVLTFLAALHAGITVDGVPAAFVPLGLPIAAGLIAWRAGIGLADAAAALEEERPGRLLRAGATQAGVFALTCVLAARLVTLGTSSVSAPMAGIAGLFLFLVTGGVAFVRWSPLADEFADRRPDWLPSAARAGTAVLTCYLGAGALLVAGSLVLHHGRVELLSRQVGGGWSGAPVLLLGILAAPNAAAAGAAYLAGPGFAIGAGSGVSLGSTVHGTLPAFPVLGAVPSGPAGTAAWLLAAATPVAAGLALVRVARAADGWRTRWRDTGLGVAFAAVLGAVLAWQAGGGIGTGRLSAVGASPWQFGLAVAAGSGVVAGASLAGLAGVAWLRGRSGDDAEPLAPARPVVVRGGARDRDRTTEGDQLAG